LKPDWIIYYDNDQAFNSFEYDPFDVPRTGVEIVIQKSPDVGYEMHRTVGDYFVYDPERAGWRITDMFGVADHLMTAKYPLVLFGRNMDNRRFKALQSRVEQECGPKSGWLWHEKRPME